MKQIINPRYANKEVNFEIVGVVKADEHGVFEISDDAVAALVVKTIKGFSLVKKVSEKVVEKPTKQTTSKNSAKEDIKETVKETVKESEGLTPAKTEKQDAKQAESVNIKEGE